MIDTASLSNAALIVIVALGMYISAFWLALIFWTFRDHRRRSRDGLASIVAALMVAVLGLPGLAALLRDRRGADPAQSCARHVLQIGFWPEELSRVMRGSGQAVDGDAPAGSSSESAGPARPGDPQAWDGIWDGCPGAWPTGGPDREQPAGEA